MSFVIPIAIMQVLLNLVETGNPIFFKATGNSILKHKWIRFLVFLIPTSLFSSSPLGTSHLIWLVFSTAIIFYLGFKISIPKKPLEQNEVISVFYLGRIGLSICIAYLVFIYYMGYFVLGGDRRPSALQLILNCFLYLVIIALIFKKNTILHEEEHGLFDYLLETYTPRNLIKLFLRISIIAIIFSILSPLNIIFFAGSMYSMIPMGIASIYYFSYNFFQNQSSGGAQVINN